MSATGTKLPCRVSEVRSYSALSPMTLIGRRTKLARASTNFECKRPFPATNDSRRQRRGSHADLGRLQVRNCQPMPCHAHTECSTHL